MSVVLLGVGTAIPSPSVSSFSIGPLTIHFYALCILAGIFAAVLLTNRLLTQRGAEPWITVDIAMYAVPFGIIGARIYHVLTHPSDYFAAGADPWAVLRIWEGGIAIFGALLGGALGAWIGCRRTGIRSTAFADALAPGIILAQAMGRFGNWFNQELFGRPVDAWWGLEIDPGNSAIPAGTPAGTLFHPTFLYESLWCVAGCLVLWAVARTGRLQWGRLFGLYLVWYGAGRVVWENLRIDPSEVILGLRTNVWAALFAIALGVAVIVVQGVRHSGPEPSPYEPGHEWTPDAAEGETSEAETTADETDAT
ncbi:MAG: prolipoprotein diacylglyceryl transferase [Cellulomonadaceae bacterium]